MILVLMIVNRGGLHMADTATIGKNVEQTNIIVRTFSKNLFSLLISTSEHGQRERLDAAEFACKNRQDMEI